MLEDSVDSMLCKHKGQSSGLNELDPLLDAITTEPWICTEGRWWSGDVFCPWTFWGQIEILGLLSYVILSFSWKYFNLCLIGWGHCHLQGEVVNKLLTGYICGDICLSTGQKSCLRVYSTPYVPWSIGDSLSVKDHHRYVTYFLTPSKAFSEDVISVQYANKLAMKAQHFPCLGTSNRFLSR